MSPEENKKVARLYHELNPEDIDIILTTDFVGHLADEANYSRDDHRNVWLVHRANFTDVIHEVLAQGDWLTIRYTRSGKLEDKPVMWQCMQLMRFANGQIAETWEVFE